MDDELALYLYVTAIPYSHQVDIVLDESYLTIQTHLLRLRFIECIAQQFRQLFDSFLGIVGTCLGE